VVAAATTVARNPAHPHSTARF